MNIRKTEFTTANRQPRTKNYITIRHKKKWKHISIEINRKIRLPSRCNSNIFRSSIDIELAWNYVTKRIER